MTQVISFDGYIPIERFDAIPWTQARVDEAALSTGPWTTIDTLALSPLDADPSIPQERNITTHLASSTMGLWYRIVFLDGSGNVSQPTSPVRNVQAAVVPVNQPMTFLDLQNAVMDSAFGEEKRESVKTWINASYGSLFDEEEWTFAQASANVSVTANSQAVDNIPGDFATALSLQRADGVWLSPIAEYRDFAHVYVGGTSIPTGRPESFTAVGLTIFVGPTSNESSDTYVLVYERCATLLIDDDDVPLIPAQYHLGLVFAAKAAGYALSDQLLAQSYSALAEAEFAGMRRKYLRSMRGTSTQSPAYRPGGYYNQR